MAGCNRLYPAIFSSETNQSQSQSDTLALSSLRSTETEHGATGYNPLFSVPVETSQSQSQTNTGTNFALTTQSEFQALVYDILPSTTAVFSYATGSRKLSANEQFLVGDQTVVSLLQTTQIKQGVSFLAANKVYTSTNKTTIV